MENINAFKVWIRGFLVFLGLVFVDVMSKRWAIAQPSDIPFLGIFNFGMSHLGPVFGALDQKNFILRIIHYTTFLGPLLLLYFFFSFQFLTLSKSKNLNIFLGVWMAGIVGNILDRIFYGAVVNFIELRLGGFHQLFNLATLMMIVGCAGFFVQLYRYRGDYIFSNKRKMRLFQLGLQVDYVGKIVFVCLFLCLTISIFSYTFMRFYLSEYSVLIQDQLLRLYLIQMLIISGLYLLIIVLIGFHFSNRFVGPIHGFEKFIEKLENGDLEATFRVRENDHHRNLEALADTIRKHWKP